jgi:four helix bundle protein
MLTNFRSYQLAVSFYRRAGTIPMPYHLKDQFRRASSSVVLNLREGSAKPTKKDRKRFYFIALGSVRECEAILDLLNAVPSDLASELDILARHVCKLCQALE